MTFAHRLYWWIPIGATISVQWPTYPTSDPNDSMREFLERYVGRQGVCWDWRLAYIQELGTTIQIKFLFKKDAVLSAIKFG